MNLSKLFRNTLVAAALSLAMFFASLVSVAPATYAATPITVGGKALVTNTGGDTIRLREGAGTKYDQISETYEGDFVTVLAGPGKDSKGNTWYKVKASKGSGWILSGFLAGKSANATASQSKSQAQAPKPAPSAPKLSGFGKVAGTDGDYLRVRSQPSRKGSVISTMAPEVIVALKQGPVVDAEGIAWYQLTAGGVTGWSMAQYLVQSKAPVQAAAKTQPAAKPAADIRSGTSRGPQPPAEVKSSSVGAALVSTAMKYLGTRYIFGGSSPRGFDCSGFVTYVTAKAGRPVSRDMYSMIGSGPRVSSKDLQPGDVLFFSNTYKRGLSHVGIYIGNGKFIHAENERTGVVISHLWSAYWAAHYTAAIRLR